MEDATESVEETSRREDGSRKSIGAPFVLTVGAGSALMYGLAYLAKRSLNLNGLVVEYAGFRYEGVRAANPAALKADVALYLAATIGVISLYLVVLSRARGVIPWSKAARVAAIAIPVCFNLVTLIGRPFLSADAFSYLAHGYLAHLPTQNPYLNGASDVAVMPPGPQIAEFGWRPFHGITPYGPLWTHLEWAAYRIASDLPSADTLDVPLGLFLIRSITVTAVLATAWLIWRALGNSNRQLQLYGTLLFLWNPLIIEELSLEGHNDALMIFFVVLGIVLAKSSRAASAGFALMLGALTKFLPLIFLPAHAGFLWRANTKGFRKIVALGLGGLLGIGLAALLYSPFWAGADTFTGVRTNSRIFLNSLSTVLHSEIENFVGDEAAKDIVGLVMGVSFFVFTLYKSWKISDQQEFLEACAWISLIYVLVFSPLLWPWYFAMPLALIALRPQGLLLAIVPVITLAGRLVAPLPTIHDNGFISLQFVVNANIIVSAVVPLMFLLAMKFLKIGSNPCLGRSST